MQQQVSSPALPGAAAVIVATNADERGAHCAWCWKRQHPNEPYPREWSSTICEACEAEMQADIARVKAKRAAERRAREAQT